MCEFKVLNILIIFVYFQTVQWIEVGVLNGILKSIGVLVAATSTSGVMLVTVEIMPTVARGSAVGFAMSMMGIGRMVSPYLALMVSIRLT